MEVEQNITATERCCVILGHLELNIRNKTNQHLKWLTDICNPGNKTKVKLQDKLK